MIYEQLLEQVSINAFVTPNALRAVVELHKPDKNNKDMCSICVDETHFECGASYPCPTIQAIEKELA